ncbi:MULTISPECIES: hypothetical protein [Nocardia]|jgi:hypothetical protein|uniref:hypothetical protein n=1 Tax=Nocardia TaxID=1817 RepID=UPI001893688C|nr:MULTISPECIES: hypothetical protein [Nocardia]MBF6326766.1 hypothetical protein [Nocardia cyriacigeorgica]
MSNNNRRRRGPRPEGAPEPRDYQAPRKTAAQREAQGVETATITYKGAEFDIPASVDDWPTLAVQAMSKNHHIDAIEHALGPVQWNRFVSQFPLKRNFDEFAELIAQELGFTKAGNS